MNDAAQALVLQLADTSKIHPLRAAYALIEPRPWWMGFYAWNGKLWMTTKKRLGLPHDMENKACAELFAAQHFETAVDAVATKLGMK